MPYLTRKVENPEPIDCKILSAALELFVADGFHSVSVHDIQKQADVSIGSIYRHFGGKEGIAKALYKHLLNEMDEMLDSVQKSKATPIEQCNKIIYLLFEYTETRKNIIAFVFHPKHEEFLPDEPPICFASPFKTLRDIIQRGMDIGEIRQCNSWVATASVFGGAIRMIQLRLGGVLEQPLPDYYDEVIDTTWSGMMQLPRETDKDSLTGT